MADWMFYMKKNKEKDAVKAKEREQKEQLKVCAPRFLELHVETLASPCTDVSSFSSLRMS